MNLNLLSHYGFSTLWHPEWIVILSLIVFCYRKLVLSGSNMATSKQRFYFYTGIVCAYICLGSPLDIIGHDFLFTVHMFQQSVLYMIVPLFLFLGIPSQLVRPILDTKTPLKILRFFLRPVLSVFLFNITLSLYHMPEIFDRVMESHFLMGLSELILFATSCFVWWNVVAPLPELENLTEIKKIFYVFMNGLLLYPACGLLIMTQSVIYQHYAHAPQLIESFTVLEDQQLGGIMMKLIQEGVLGTCIGILFFRWYRRENPGRVDEIPEQMKNQ